MIEECLLSILNQDSVLSGWTLNQSQDYQLPVQQTQRMELKSKHYSRSNILSCNLIEQQRYRDYVCQP